MKIAVGTITNNTKILRRILMQSDLSDICEGMDGLYVVENAHSASQGWNILLNVMVCDVAILCHHDMYFPPGWFWTLKMRLEALPESWVIAGFFGITDKFEQCGKLHDRRVPLPLVTKHAFPVEAITVDGCCMAINTKHGLRFDEKLRGFDLYDTYAALKAREMGGTVWVVDCPPEHYATRSWEWSPDAAFLKNWEYLKSLFPNERVCSTCVWEAYSLERVERDAQERNCLDNREGAEPAQSVEA